MKIHTLAFAMSLAATSIATAHAAPAAPEFFARKGAPGQVYPFSEATRAGDMLYLSGDIGIGADGKLVSGGIAAETRQTMDNIKATLARHHSALDRVVQCTVALADMAEWPAFNDAYKPYFKDHFPARMAFGATALALGARVEIQCNAVAGS